MQVKDLVPKKGNVNIQVDIVDVGEVREFQKFGKSGRVATATAMDETGNVKLSLWNDDIDKVKPGDKVSIENGYVSEWQGELQLTTGRFGKLEVVGKSEGRSEESNQEKTSASSSKKKTNSSKDNSEDYDSEDSYDRDSDNVEEEDIDDELI